MGWYVTNPFQLMVFDHRRAVCDRKCLRQVRTKGAQVKQKMPKLGEPRCYS